MKEKETNDIANLRKIIDESNKGHSEVMNSLSSLVVALTAMCYYIDSSNIQPSIKKILSSNLRGIAHRLNTIATGGTVKFDSEAVRVVSELASSLSSASLIDRTDNVSDRNKELLGSRRWNTDGIVDEVRSGVTEIERMASDIRRGKRGTEND